MHSSRKDKLWILEKKRDFKTPLSALILLLRHAGFLVPQTGIYLELEVI